MDAYSTVFGESHQTQMEKEAGLGNALKALWRGAGRTMDQKAVAKLRSARQQATVQRSSLLNQQQALRQQAEATLNGSGAKSGFDRLKDNIKGYHQQGKADALSRRIGDLSRRINKYDDRLNSNPYYRELQQIASGRVAAREAARAARAAQALGNGTAGAATTAKRVRKAQGGGASKGRRARSSKATPTPVPTPAAPVAPSAPTPAPAALPTTIDTGTGATAAPRAWQPILANKPKPKPRATANNGGVIHDPTQATSFTGDSGVIHDPTQATAAGAARNALNGTPTPQTTFNLPAMTQREITYPTMIPPQSYILQQPPAPKSRSLGENLALGGIYGNILMPTIKYLFGGRDE